jgi:pimeloyl-ACP methyl ester carboxylesterase
MTTELPRGTDVLDDPLSDVALESDRRETNGVDLHVVAAGPEDGPLVVCLHGFPEYWYGWRGQVPALVEAGYRVLVPDQRGYNLSEKPQGVRRYGLNELRDDVRGLIESTGRDQAHLVGHDWGAMVAWYLAMTHPEDVGRLVVANVPHPVVFRRQLLRNPRQMLRSWYAATLQVPWLPEFVLRANDYAALLRTLRSTSEPGTFSDADLLRYRESYDQTGALTGMLDWYRAALRHRPSLTADPWIDPPTLLIWGENDDALIPEMAPESIGLCSDGRLERFPDATHWVIHERTDRVNELVLEHLGPDGR